MNEPTNNEELARAYFLVTAQLIDGEELHLIGRGRNKIKNYQDSNIVDFYKTHCSLDALPGFQKEKRTLELILQKGVQKAREKMYQKKIRQLQQKPFTSPPETYDPEKCNYSPFFV